MAEKYGKQYEAAPVSILVKKNALVFCPKEKVEEER